MAKEQLIERDNRTTHIFEGPFNGFSHATKITRMWPNVISYTLEAESINPHVKIPVEGEYWLHPSDILEKMHMYVGYSYDERGQLQTFSFMYSHFNDIDGEFSGKRYEIGTEAIMKDFVSTKEFGRIYQSGEVSYKLNDEVYAFELLEKNIAFSLNGGRIAEFPTVKSNTMEGHINYPVSLRTPHNS